MGCGGSERGGPASQHSPTAPRAQGGWWVTGRDPSHPLTSCPHSEEPVEPQAEAKIRLDLVPRQAGLHKLMVDFESDKLTGVKGYRNVIIAPQPK